jgi:hypothetical protein
MPASAPVGIGFAGADTIGAVRRAAWAADDQAVALGVALDPGVAINLLERAIDRVNPARVIGRVCQRLADDLRKNGTIEVEHWGYPLSLLLALSVVAHWRGRFVLYVLSITHLLICVKHYYSVLTRLIYHGILYSNVLQGIKGGDDPCPKC